MSIPPTPTFFREHAGNPVHESGLMHTSNQWGTILYLPGLCADFGEPCPEWARLQYEHAHAVQQSAPAPLLDALVHSMRHHVPAPCPIDTALRGVALDLCVVLPTTRDIAGVQPTLFGYGVSLLYRIHQLENGDHDRGVLRVTRGEA